MLYGVCEDRGIVEEGRGGILVMILRKASNMRVLHRIQTWALEEARRRLEKEGILDDPEK